MTVENDTHRLGFIGTGSIASAVVEGFCTSGRPCRIVLSPRNEQKAAALAARFEQVQRAATNQEVLDRSQVVLLALRPGVAAETLGRLRFREDHTVLSFIALQPLQALAMEVRPARRVFKVLPCPTWPGTWVWCRSSRTTRASPPAWACWASPCPCATSGSCTCCGPSPA